MIKDKIKALTDDNQWLGGWYQAIEFPCGNRTISNRDIFKMDSKGEVKWEAIEHFLSKGNNFLEIGSNAGLYLILAKKHYKNIYGIEKSEYFYKQCQFVMEQFKSKARVYLSDALDFDYKQLPQMDIIFMANTLYWVTYSDEEGFVEDHENKMDRFLKTIANKTKFFLTIGTDDINRVGGSLELTSPAVNKHFDILNDDVMVLNDRPINIIYARSKYTKANKKTTKKK